MTSPFEFGKSTGVTCMGGFVLIEVLVAILILSFGVLGMAGMQAASLQANRDAKLQSTAVAMARELANLMRNNQGVAIQTTAALNPYLINYQGATLTAPSAICVGSADCQTSTGSPAKVAAWDVYDWLTRVSSELPGARVLVCFDATPYEASSGLPQWNCTGTGGVAMVKIGWTRRKFNRAATADSDILDQAVRPSIIFPLTAGRTS